MESDRHYFFEGLFILVFALAATVVAVWLGRPGHRDDVTYRIRFPDSVSGLAAGDTVKFRGIDVGTVGSMDLDPDDSRLVRVDVRLRKDTPVKTDTRASLTMKGITGVVFVELNGGDPAAKTLLEVTGENEIPEIVSERTGLKAMIDGLPKIVEKFSGLEDQLKKVVTGVGGLTKQVSDDPSSLVWGKSRDKGKEPGKK